MCYDLTADTHHYIVLNEIVTKVASARNFVDKLLKLDHLGSALIETKMIAGFQIDSRRAVRIFLQVDLEHILRYIVVVQLVVTESYVNVQRQIFPTDLNIVKKNLFRHKLSVDKCDRGFDRPVFKQNFFVNIDGFLIVSSKIVYRSETELVFRDIAKLVLVLLQLRL